MQANTEASPGPLVGLREAARLLTEAGHPISHSTLSRQIGKHIPNRGTPKKPLVNVEEVLKARKDSVDPRLQRTKPQLPLEPTNAEAAAQTATLPSSSSPSPGSANDHRADLERAKARLAELDLEERLGKLVDRRDVADAMETVARTLRDQLIASADVLASDIAGLTDVAEIRVKIEEMHRKVLLELSKAFRRLAVAAPEESADAA